MGFYLAKCFVNPFGLLFFKGPGTASRGEEGSFLEVLRKDLLFGA